jgi:hypothetical protein
VKVAATLPDSRAGHGRRRSLVVVLACETLGVNPQRWPVRPVLELAGERERGGTGTLSALAGFI